MGKDLDGIITSWNTGAEKIFGYTADEMLGTSIMRLIPDDRQEEESKVLEKIHRGESLDNLETLRRTKSGKLISVSVTVCPIRDINGKIIGVSKVAHDITERKLAEQALGASEMMLEEIINAIPARVFWKDKNLAYLGCNAAFARDAGFAGPKDIVRKDDYQMGWRDQAEKYRADDREVIESGCAKLFMEESLTTSEGNTITLLTSKTPLRNSKREIIGMLGTYIDITVRLKLEQQLRQSQKMEGIGLLASGVAHDFNNILAVIQMQSDLLKTEAGITPAQSETAVEIGKAVQRASALTHQLLLFSRKQMLQLRDLDLNGSINEMIKMLRRTLGDDIQLQFKFSMQPTFVHADAVMMDQVLMNLALNARDAMPKGGQLIIETSIVEFDETAASHSAQIRPGKFVCLSVGDTGCGIPRENLQKIFEPFFTTKEVGKGTGLGLATVFGIVQQHNGWIDVYSEVGHGTTFRIYLPRLDKTSDQKFVSPATEPVRGGDETILLVEDEPRLRASVKNILSRLGYNVLDAANGVEALEVWKKHRNEVHFAQKVWNQQRDEIHLLLTDMVMPGGITGIGLAERLLKDNPKLKVIYASGYSAEVAGKDFPLQEGVNFLTKPFQAQKLAQTVRQSLDTKI
jgi:PAS domain S-box-containing protein